MSGKAATSKARIVGLDALRGLAVGLMIQQHLGVWLWQGPGQGHTKFDYPFLVAFNALGGGAAPLFITLAGLGSALFMSRRSDLAAADRTMFLRGLTLMAFGYLLSFLTPSWFGPRSWFVLHLMGFGMCLVPIFRRLSTRGLLIAAGVILFTAPLLQTMLDTPGYLNNARMAGHIDGKNGAPIIAGGHLQIATVEGQFPIFPWLSLFVAGIAIGRWVVAGELRKVTILGAVMFGLGALMLAAWFLALKSPAAPPPLQRVIGFNIPFFPSTTSTILVVGGLVSLAVGGVFWWERKRKPTEAHPMVCLGRASLTLLLLHVVVFRQHRPFGLWKNLDPAAVGVFIVGALLVFALLSMLWRRIDYRYGAEWLLRVVGNLAGRGNSSSRSPR